MSSGFSYSGRRPRCHPYFVEFMKCFNEASSPTQCTLQREDYMECLHGTKEILRNKAIAEEYQRQVIKHADEDRKKADVLPGGSASGLGLIKKKEE